MQERMQVLLRAAYDILKRCNDSHYVLNAVEVCAQYDGTNCDGMCLMDDIATALDLEDGTEPRPLLPEPLDT
jgi:hypothetical protein